MPQALSAQLVCQDSKAREGNEDLLVNRSLAAAAPSPSSSPPRVLIYEVPQAPQDHLGHQDLPSQAHQDPTAPQRTSTLALQAHLAPEAPKETKVIPESQGLLAFLAVALKGDHRPAQCTCQAPQVPLGPLDLRAPSAAPAWRFSTTSLSTCRVTVSGLLYLEFRVPRAHLVPLGLSSPWRVRLSTTQSWQTSS